MAVARGLAMRVSVSAYLGGVGLAPHSDDQCTVVLQLKGRKRWRRWLREEASLPVDDLRVFGKVKGRELVRPWRLISPRALCFSRVVVFFDLH